MFADGKVIEEHLEHSTGLEVSGSTFAGSATNRESSSNKMKSIYTLHSYTIEHRGSDRLHKRSLHQMGQVCRV